MNTPALLALKKIKVQLDVEMWADLMAFKGGRLSETEVLERGAWRQFERRYCEWQTAGLIPQIQATEGFNV